MSIVSRSSDGTDGLSLPSAQPQPGPAMIPSASTYGPGPAALINALRAELQALKGQLRTAGLWPTLANVYDRFAQTIAAGDVGDTYSTSGHLRTVVDSEDKLSEGSGVLSASGGAATPAWGDPGVWYAQPIPRARGRVFAVTLTPGTVANVRVGWAAASGGSGAVNGMITLASTGYLYAHENSTNAYWLLPWDATAHRLYIVLRDAGVFVFARGTNAPRGRLLFIADGAAGTPLYPCIENYNVAFTADNLVVSDTLWCPSPWASDGFTRLSATLAASRTDGKGHQEQNGGEGLAWAANVGTWLGGGNVASASALTGGVANATVDAGLADCYVRAKVTRAAGNPGIVVRYVDGDNYIRAVHTGTNAQLIKRVSGVETTVINEAATYAAGGYLGVSCVGTGFTLLYNGEVVGTLSAISDAGLQAATKVGLFTDNTGNSFASFEAWPAGSGGEYEPGLLQFE
jgi:hypothetical protein